MNAIRTTLIVALATVVLIGTGAPPPVSRRRPPDRTTLRETRDRRATCRIRFRTSSAIF